MWGDNEYGALGQNQHDTHRSSPVQIPGTTWDKFTCYLSLSAAIKTDGTLWMWGRNDDGCLGQNQRESNFPATSSPTQVPGTTWKKVDTTNRGALAVKTDGTLWAWGNNSWGQLGQNQGTSPNSDKHRSSPTQIPGTAWDTCSMAGSSSLATRTDGTVWSWGYDSYGNIGHNSVSYTHLTLPTIYSV